MKVPSEDYECFLLVEWLRSRNYRFSHVPNGMFTRSHAVKNKNTKLGVSPGVPDYVICLKAGRLLWLELKRTKNSRTSPEQLAWLEALNQCRTPAFVAKGCAEAIRIILEQETLAHGLVAE